jgi:hypothetical protein
MRENELPAWNDTVVWEDFRLSYISEAIWMEYIQQMKSACFTQRSQSGSEN